MSLGSSFQWRNMKTFLFLSCILTSLTGSMMAQARIVQAVSAQSPNLACASQTPCPPLPDTLTVSFGATQKGNTFFVVYDGDLLGFANRTCTDNLGQVWIHVPNNGGFTLDFYTPPLNRPFITSVTCSGGITTQDPLLGSNILSTLFFLELSGVQPGSFVSLINKSPGSSAVPPLQCIPSGVTNSPLPPALALYFMDTAEGFVNVTPDTITPLSPTVNNLLTVFQSFFNTTANQIQLIESRAVFYQITDGTTPSPFFSFLAAPKGDVKSAQCDGVLFSPNQISMVDPVPDLVQNFSVIGATGNNVELLALHGTSAQGVAADGAAQLLLRIPTLNVGDQVTLSLQDDQSPSQATADTDSYGALGFAGDSSQTINQNKLSQISVTALSTNEGPMAFAVYRAPRDFPRASGQDANANQRKAFIKVQSNGTSAFAVAINIVRPPVVFIHGLWAGATSWNNFQGQFPNFRTDFFAYDNPLSPVATDPVYDVVPLRGVRANSLGFFYNATNAARFINSTILDFKNGNNPVNMPVAALQADIVAHSMGGNIARFMLLAPGFISNANLGQGLIHKVITIDTPHLGSPLATQLLQPGGNRCVAAALATVGNYAFNQVAISQGTPSVNGAVGDLAVGSPALGTIASSLGHPFAIALIAGTMTSSNLAALDNAYLAKSVRCTCNGENVVSFMNCSGAPGSTLAHNFTSALWPQIFGSNDPASSDGIVALTSQLNGLDQSAAGSVFVQRVHGLGAIRLGLLPPTMLDSDVVPKVLFLLNKPVTDAVFQQVNP
jgi:pimeloyl-ACP methyl ester carboxylesterase